MRFEARDLVVRYRSDARPALEGVGTLIEASLLTAVLGPNGSGKSTLLRTLLGVRAPERGEARIEGRVATGWSRRELARKVGVVTQSETPIFPLSVREFVGMGRYPHLTLLQSEGAEDRRIVEESMRSCAVEELANREVGTLSGGEFQRVRIARALAQEPEAFLLDEPTANLDVRHEMEIFQLLRGLSQGGKTVLLTTHHLNLAARFADRILLLEEGRIAADGTPEEVFQEDILTRVYGWRLLIDEDPQSGRPRVTPST